MLSSAMQQAFEEIKKLSQDPETYWLAISEEVRLRDQVQRATKAREEQREREIVLIFHGMRLPPEMIAKATQLSIGKVHKIIESAHLVKRPDSARGPGIVSLSTRSRRMKPT